VGLFFSKGKLDKTVRGPVLAPPDPHGGSGIRVVSSFYVRGILQLV
jgi:hypothetical protein